MITDGMGISHDGLMYEGKLISAIPTASDSNIYACEYKWLYGIYRVFLVK